MNFESLESLSEYIYEFIIDNTEMGDRGNHLWIHCSYFGSQLYHPELAKDYDISVILSGSYARVFYISKVHKLDITFKGLPCDLKVGAFSDLDKNELMELHYCIKHKLYAVADSGSYTMSNENIITTATNIGLDDRTMIRHAISSKCSNSFVKAKKKLIVEKDYDRYASMKSLFHSIRIAVFACRFAKDGVINPTECKDLYEEIKNFYDNHSDEEVLKELTSGKFKNKYNETMSRFRLYHPK